MVRAHFICHLMRRLDRRRVAQEAHLSILLLLERMINSFQTPNVPRIVKIIIHDRYQSVVFPLIPTKSIDALTMLCQSRIYQETSTDERFPYQARNYLRTYTPAASSHTASGDILSRSAPAYAFRPTRDRRRSPSRPRRPSRRSRTAPARPSSRPRPCRHTRRSPTTPRRRRCALQSQPHPRRAARTP